MHIDNAIIYVTEVGKRPRFRSLVLTDLSEYYD